LVDELLVQRQAELLEDASRRAATKGVVRPRSVVPRTDALRKRIGAIVINVGQRIQRPVVNPPTIARMHGGLPSGSSLRLF